ncbi:MAG: hypothetical protein ACLSBH_21430 [Coprobacillus cateniformis]
MLKTMGMHKLVAPAIALMLGIGVVLTGIGFAMERNTEYLKKMEIINGIKLFILIKMDGFDLV